MLGSPSTIVLALTLSIIQKGSDLSNAKKRGAADTYLRKRALVLQQLRQRLAAPRPIRTRLSSSKPPSLVLQTGEVYSFPTMEGDAWHPYLPEDGPFESNGWGALVVLATGRAFDWLPWCALASLTVDPARKPTLADALRARLIFHSETEGAGRFVPKGSHARGLGLDLIGRVDLEPKLVQPHLSRWPIERAIQYDWTIAYAARNCARAEDVACKLASLLVLPMEPNRENATDAKTRRR